MGKRIDHWLFVHVHKHLQSICRVCAAL